MGLVGVVTLAIAVLAQSARDIDANATHLETSGSFAAAAVEYGKLLTIITDKEKKDYTTYRIARCRYRANEYSAARHLVEGLIEGSPDSKQQVLWKYLLGEVCYVEGRVYEAVKHLSEAINAPQSFQVGTGPLERIEDLSILAATSLYMRSLENTGATDLANKTAGDVATQSYGLIKKTPHDSAACLIALTEWTRAQIVLAECARRRVGAANPDFFKARRIVVDARRYLKSMSCFFAQKMISAGKAKVENLDLLLAKIEAAQLSEMGRFSDAETVVNIAIVSLEQTAKTGMDSESSDLLAQFYHVRGTIQIERVRASSSDVEQSGQMLDYAERDERLAAKIFDKGSGDLNRAQVLHNLGLIYLLRSLRAANGDEKERLGMIAHDLFEREYVLFKGMGFPESGDHLLEVERFWAETAGICGRFSMALDKISLIAARWEGKGRENNIDFALVHETWAKVCARAGKLDAAAHHWRKSRELVLKHFRSFAQGMPAAQQAAYATLKDIGPLQQALRFGIDASASLPGLQSETAEWLANGKGQAFQTLGLAYGRHAKSQETREMLERQSAALLSGDLERMRELELKRIGIAAAAGKVEIPNWTKLQEMRDRLEDEEVVIDFFTVPKENTLEYVAWVWDRSSPVTIVELGAVALIDEGIDKTLKSMKEFANNLASGVAPESEDEVKDHILKPLSTILMEPIWKAAKNKSKWVISPDGNLWNVPWSGLLIGEQYALDRLEVTTISSPRSLVHRQKQDPPKFTNALVVANPSFGPPGFFDFVDLSTFGDDNAAKSVLEPAKIELLTDDSANKMAILTHAQFPEILYLGTHGVYDRSWEEKSSDPFFSCFVAVTGANQGVVNENGDGKLPGVITAAEIVGLDLSRTKLVVLSACESGVGKAQHGHGAATLRHAFHLAGAHAAVSTLWEVHTLSGNELMIEMLRRRANGETCASALKSAQKHVRGLANYRALRTLTFNKNKQIVKAIPDKSPFAHPYYWAGATLSER